MMEYIDLVTSEHSDKPKFTSTVEITTIPHSEIIETYGVVQHEYDVDTAIGVQLDVVGEWVGITRKLPIPLVGVFFTLDTGPGFDDGIFISEYDSPTGLTSLPDDEYRILIKTKILNNQWNGSNENAIIIGKTLFENYNYDFFIQDNCNMTMNLGIITGGIPPIIIQAMLTNNILDIRPATVQLINYIWQSGDGKMFMLDSPEISADFAGFDSGRFAIVTANY